MGDSETRKVQQCQKIKTRIDYKLVALECQIALWNVGVRNSFVLDGGKKSHLRFAAQWAAKSCGCEKSVPLGLGCLS